KAGERTLAAREVYLLKETEDRVIPPSSEVITVVDHTIADELKDATRTPAALRKIVTLGALLNESGSAPDATVALGDSGSRPAAQRFTVISSESTHAEPLSTGPSSSLKFVSNPLTHQTKVVVVTSSSVHEAGTSSAAPDSTSLVHEAGTSSAVLNNTSLANDFYESQTIASAEAKDVHVPKWNITNNFKLDDTWLFCNFVDHMPPPGYWASLRNMPSPNFVDQYNINAALRSYMNFELRLRFEYEMEQRSKLEKKFLKQEEKVQRKDKEIADLKSHFKTYKNVQKGQNKKKLRQIMRKISSWWNIDYSDVNSYEEWRVWLVSIRIQSKLKGVLEVQQNLGKVKLIVPIKVNIIAWKVKSNALPTRFNISRRGMDIDSIVCPICNAGVESTNHIFFQCVVVRQIMRKISFWWNIDYSDVNSYEEWRVWLVSIRIQSKLKGVLEGVYYGLWWYMWNFRNKLLFDKKIPEKALIFDNLVSSSFYWCKFRCKASFKWDDWLKNPYIVLV
ncbi:RNA-directed DNA polymerase, eukaryota, partial [Tanacetum coccineum]